MSPQNFKHFRILELLGKGGMGEVYLALDTTLERKVALKFLPRELLRDPSAQGRLLDEARSVSRVQHPNIAVVHSIEEDGGIFAICMEYVEGATLKQMLGRGPVPLHQIARIGAETAAGMQAAHEKGIVHRDLKPANIMITRRGQVKIMDFGLALRPERVVNTLGPNTYGTVQYMSPEQARGETLTPSSDIFSFGSTFYELIAGRPPFSAPNDLAILQAIIRNEPEPLREHRREVPPALEQIVRGCMAKAPQARWESMASLAEEFRYLEPTLVTGPRDLISELSTGLAEPSQRLHHAPDNHGRVGRRSSVPGGRVTGSGPTALDRIDLDLPEGFVVHEVRDRAPARQVRRIVSSRRPSVERTGEFPTRTAGSAPPPVLGPELPTDPSHSRDLQLNSTAEEWGAMTQRGRSALDDIASRQAAIAAEAARRGQESRPIAALRSTSAGHPRTAPRPGPFRDLQQEADHLITIGRRRRSGADKTHWPSVIVPLLIALAVLVVVGVVLLERAGVQTPVPALPRISHEG
jgi:serine/threonine protein kinase